jgi:mRNA-degrading endonuclease HigB of HigAB toxin-antitoxin module
MAITKSNKQELSLDHGKPNEKGGCTLTTPYALMRSLILDSQITISSLDSSTPLHMKDVSQLNKWASELKWTSRGCIYTSHSQSQPLSANSAFFVLTGRAGRLVAMVDFEIEKVYLTPPSIKGGLPHPLNYETIYFTPWTFRNRSNYPRAVLDGGFATVIHDPMSTKFLL